MGDVTIEKIDEVTIIPVGKVSRIKSLEKDGVFIEGRTVTLTSFLMSRNVVTQGLFESVMGYNPGSKSSLANAQE